MRRLLERTLPSRGEQRPASLADVPIEPMFVDERLDHLGALGEGVVDLHERLPVDRADVDAGAIFDVDPGLGSEIRARRT